MGEYKSRMERAAKGNLLYNMAMLAQADLGAVLGIRLNCSYEGLKFIPLEPVLETYTALVWKKEQIFFICRGCLSGIHKKTSRAPSLCWGRRRGT